MARERQQKLTLGYLRRITADLPDDTPLATPKRDHCYGEATVEIADAIYHSGYPGQWSECDYDMTLEPEETRVKLVVIR